MIWTDRVEIYMDKAGSGQIIVSEQLVPVISAFILDQNIAAKSVTEEIKGTKRFQSAYSFTLGSQFDPEILTKLEAVFNELDIKYERHLASSGDDHVDASYDLTNVSVERSDN